MDKLSPIRPDLSDHRDLKRILLIVDYANVLYRSYFSSIRSVNIYPWLPIIRFIDSLRLFTQKTMVKDIPIEFIFAGESRTKLKRSELDSSYKQTRNSVTDEPFQNFRKILPRILEDMDASITHRDGAEADDVIASIVNYICERSKPPWEPKTDKVMPEVFIFTDDKDLYQLLDYDRCCIYKYPGVFYTRTNFIDEYGFHPSEFIFYKAMIGDRSDNIAGVNGIGPVKAKKHILEGTIPEDDPDYQDALRLISFDYDLDVPNVGEKLWFDDQLSRSKPLIFDYYKEANKAFVDIQLALRKFMHVYQKGE